MTKFIIPFLIFFLYAATLIAQYDTLDLYCAYTPEDTVINDSPGIQPFTGTTNMAIVLCVEKGQDTIIQIDFIDELKLIIPDYFEKASFGNYSVSVTDVLVKDIDSLAETATLFELPDTIVMYPPLNPVDTSFVVNPWMVRNILAQADDLYDFNNFDSDGDGIVDFLAFMLIKFRGGWSTGTTGLSIKEFYVTNDTTASGDPVMIDGTGYLSFSGDRAIIQRRRNATSESLISLSVHELGHALFDFPDMLRDEYPHYALGQFCAMAYNGFGGIAALYNPVLRISKGWAPSDQLTSNTTINFSDFDLTGQSFYYELPYYDHPSPPQFKTGWGQKFYLTYYSKPSSNRWQTTWPVPLSPIDYEYRGILIWHKSWNGWWAERRNLPIDIESAHGKWDWIIDYADTVQPPNDKRAIRSNYEDPLYGYDSLEVKYSYRWLQYDPNGYIPMSTYPDGRIGSETCFFDPLNPKNFSFTSNPSSNSIGYGGAVQLGRISPSGFKMNNLRLEGSSVKAEIFVGDYANTINENITLTKGTWAMISDLTITPGVTLTLEPGTYLYFYDGSSLVVNGTLVTQGTFAEQITLDFVDGQSNGINVRNGGTINLDYCQIKNAATGISTFHAANKVLVNHCTFENIIGNGISVGSNTQKLEVLNSSFTNCGSYCINIFGPMVTTPLISSNSFQNSAYGILASSVNNILIRWNNILDTQLGLSIIQIPDAHIIGNMIISTQNLNSGIFFNNSNGYIRQNLISGHTRGISLANSSPKIGENQIYSNRINGIYASSGSVPDLRLFLGVSITPGCPPYYYALSGCNEVFTNGGYSQAGSVGDDGSEIFLSKSYILMDIGNNKIVDDRVPSPPLYNTLLLMNGTTNQDQQIMARYNWWGLTEVNWRRFGSLSVIYEPIGADDCPIPSMMPCSLIVNIETDGIVIDTLYPVYDAEEFSELDEEIAFANQYYLAGDYINAENIYTNVVEDYPDSIQSFFAGAQLLAIKKIQNVSQEDFTSLQNFYSSYVGNVSDTILSKMIENLITLCYIGKEDYETAIGRLEDIIVQNPEEEEAIYAEIDAITAAMLANGGGGNLGKYTGKYSASSIDDYGNKIGELITKLGSSGSKENTEAVIPVEYKLYQNYPNPFNPITIIKYDIVKVQDVKLNVYDILGRQVATLINEQQQPGSYEVSWDASNFASGIYFYTLTSGNFIATKKLILLK